MSQLLSIDVRSSKELQAVILATTYANRDAAKVIRTYSKSVIGPEWKKGVDLRASTALERRILAGTANVAVSDSNVKLRAAMGAKRLSGGLVFDDARGVEFGANRFLTRPVRTHSRKGKAYTVTRHTQRQFKDHTNKGYVIYPTASNLIPRVAALWSQSVFRLFRDAFEGRSS